MLYAYIQCRMGTTRSRARTTTASWVQPRFRWLEQGHEAHRLPRLLRGSRPRSSRNGGRARSPAPERSPDSSRRRAAGHRGCGNTRRTRSVQAERGPHWRRGMDARQRAVSVRLTRSAFSRSHPSQPPPTGWTACTPWPPAPRSWSPRRARTRTARRWWCPPTCQPAEPPTRPGRRAASAHTWLAHRRRPGPQDRGLPGSPSRIGSTAQPMPTRLMIQRSPSRARFGVTGQW